MNALPNERETLERYVSTSAWVSKSSPMHAQQRSHPLFFPGLKVFETKRSLLSKQSLFLVVHPLCRDPL